MLLILVGACEEVRLDPSPSCSYRNDRAAIPDSGVSPEGEPSLVRAGVRHACAMVDSRDARCWGANDLGQLSQSFDPGPGEAWEYDDWRGTALPVVGGAHACVFNEDEVACWGNNDLGQLGNGSTDPHAGVFSLELESETFRTLAAGLYHTCVGDETDVYCWGDNRYGQLGRVTAESSAQLPARVEGLPHGVFRLAAGAYHTCALVGVGLGEMYCWGDDRFGAIGDGEAGAPFATPVRVTIDPVRAIGAGPHHTCAISDADSESAGALFCWGRNESGELGDATGERADTPRRVETEHAFVELIGSDLAELARDPSGALVATDGAGVACALTADDLAYCWGSNRYGHIAGTTDAIVTTPTLIDPRRWENLTLGGTFACGVTPAEVAIDFEIPARLFCWGQNEHGELGRAGEASLVPMLTEIFVAE
jgi:alpha-tubulin suppressor-like RCC1 family protein